MKMLIVDDHQLVRDGFRHVAQQLARDADPVSILEVADYTSALRCADEHPDLDLMVLDLCLPDVAGYAALADLQEHHPEIPVVVMSGLDDPEIVRESIERGALGFIPKSSSAQRILQALRQVLAGEVYVPYDSLEENKDRPLPVAVASPSSSDVMPRDLGLTERQVEVLRLVLAGKTNKMICRDLGLAEGTVKNHVAAVLKALEAETRVHVVLVAARIGLNLKPKF